MSQNEKIYFKLKYPPFSILNAFHGGYCISGRVINVTSAKGKLCLPLNAVYGAAKYAVEAFSDVLRLEMKKFGVKVVIVEPGDFGGTTGMLSSKTVSARILCSYTG